MTIEAKKEVERTCWEEILPTFSTGGMELVPWIVRDSRDTLGVPVHIYDHIDALTEPGKNFISLWSGGNFLFFCLSPSDNKLGKEIDSRHASSRGGKLIVSSVIDEKRNDRYVQVLLADLPLLSNADGFGRVWCLRDYKSEILEVTSEHIFENPRGLAFIPIPPVGDKSGSGGILVMESDLLRDPQAQETLKDFLLNREFRIK